MKDYFKHYRDYGHTICYMNSSKVKTKEIKCGYCGMIVAPSEGYTIKVGDSSIAYVYKCPHCDNPIIYFLDDAETLPGYSYGRNIKHLPDSISTLFRECRTCYANQCYTASQMIARTILMHIAVEQGADKGNTFAFYVDYLDKKGFIPPNGKAWVDFIRKSGNESNHELVIKEKDETEKVITFLSTLLLFIYELPKEMEQQ